MHTIILFLNTVLLLTYGSISTKMCSSRNVFVTFHLHIIPRHSGSILVTGIYFSYEKKSSSYVRMRAYRTVKCQKRLVFALRVLHTLLLQFVCDKCIRVTFGTRMSTRTQTFDVRVRK